MLVTTVKIERTYMLFTGVGVALSAADATFWSGVKHK